MTALSIPFLMACRTLSTQLSILSFNQKGQNCFSSKIKLKFICPPVVQQKEHLDKRSAMSQLYM